MVLGSNREANDGTTGHHNVARNFTVFCTVARGAATEINIPLDLRGEMIIPLSCVEVHSEVRTSPIPMMRISWPLA